MDTHTTISVRRTTRNKLHKAARSEDLSMKKLIEQLIDNHILRKAHERKLYKNLK